MKVDPAGQPAQTRWRVLGRGEWRGAPIAWLALSPLTGRTHQLRVHAASEGWPILGDRIYGEGADVPLQLLARRIEVPMSKNKPPVVVEAPAPEHMRSDTGGVRVGGGRASLVDAVADRVGPAWLALRKMKALYDGRAQRARLRGRYSARRGFTP